MTVKGGDFLLCGWHVRSALNMPELLLWQGDDHSVDVEITFDTIPEVIETPLFALPHSKVWEGNRFLLDMQGVGRFWVENGRRVLIEPAIGALETDIRAFVLSSVLGVLCHQRGLLPMHASSICLNGQAVLMAGMSGAGKSTLCAALRKRGHALVADDISAFDPVTSHIYPAFPQHKLAADVLNVLGLEHTGMIPNRPGQPKFRVPLVSGFEAKPLKPVLVYVINNFTLGAPTEIESLTPAVAMAQLDRMVFRRQVGLKIQSPKTLFSLISKLASTAQVHLLNRQEGISLSGLEGFAERVEAHALSL